MDHGAPGAPTGELLSSPHCKGQEQHQLKLNDYGLGVDCHSRFFQICLLVNTGKSLVTNEITVRAVWPELMKAKQTVLSILAVHGVCVGEDDLRYTLESTAQYHKPICLAWRGRPSIINPAELWRSITHAGSGSTRSAQRSEPSKQRPSRSSTERTGWCAEVSLSKANC